MGIAIASDLVDAQTSDRYRSQAIAIAAKRLESLPQVNRVAVDRKFFPAFSNMDCPNNESHVLDACAPPPTTMHHFSRGFAHFFISPASHFSAFFTAADASPPLNLIAEHFPSMPLGVSFRISQHLPLLQREVFPHEREVLTLGALQRHRVQAMLSVSSHQLKQRLLRGSVPRHVMNAGTHPLGNLYRELRRRELMLHEPTLLLEHSGDRSRALDLLQERTASLQVLDDVSHGAVQRVQM